jgi:hypothetical protein
MAGVELRGEIQIQIAQLPLGGTSPTHWLVNGR